MVNPYIPDARDWIGALEAGQQAGMTQRREKAARTAGGLMTAGDYTGAAAAIMPYDMRSGTAIQSMGAEQAAAQRRAGYGAKIAAGQGDEAVKEAYGAGDFELAGELRTALDAADERQKKMVHEKAVRVAEIVAPLGDIPESDIGARKAYITQHRADLLGAGYTEQQIDAFEPTNANLAPIYAQAMGLKDYLEKTAPKVVGNALVRPDGRVVYEGERYLTVPEGGKIVAVGGAGSGGGGEGDAGAPATLAPTKAPTGGIYGQIGQIASQEGAQPNEVTYLQRLAQVESDGDPTARNGRSTSLFQFHPDTFASVGGGNINDVGDQTKAALRLSRRDRQSLAEIGIEPTDANLYIMHQQGAAGGRALLTAPPDASAVAVLTPLYGNETIARKAITGNGGTAEMSAGQFVQMWRQRWSGARPAAAAAPAQGGGRRTRIVAEGAPKPRARPATAAEKAQYGVAADVPAEIEPNGSFRVITGTAATLKRVPAQVQSGYVDNRKAMSQIDAAIAAVEKTPGAFGLKNKLGDEVMQRLDPGGVDARAMVSNIGSLLIHDRSGAAVTAAEQPRLKPFVPKADDTAAAALRKLKLLKEHYGAANAEIETVFGEHAGYAPMGGASRGGAGDADEGVLQQARDAISRGAPRAAVIQRLRENGIDPAGL